MFLTNDELFNLMLLKASSGSGATEATATGNPLTFLTDLARPLKSLLIPFTPKQEGTGDPSPSNIRPIVPWNGLTVWQAGANLADFTIIQGGIAGATGSENSSTKRVKTKDAFFIKGNGTKYTIDADGVGAVWVYNYNLDGSYSESQDQQGFKSLPYTYTRNGGDCLLKLAFRVNMTEEIEVSPSDISNVRFQVGTTLLPYEAPAITETDIAFPEAVYGCVLDAVTGGLWATYSFVEKKWSDGNVPTVLGDYTRKQFNMGREPMTAQSSKATERFCNIAPWLVQYNDQSTHYYFYQSGEGETCIGFVFLPSDTDPDTKIQLAVAMKNPVLVGTLTPSQITALVGNNTIWSDADGSMTAIYYKKG